MDVEFCWRIGERGERNRPLIVGFYTEWSRSILLKNAKYLNESEYENVSIAPDLTQRQRAAERDLVAEAERRNEEDLTEDDISKNLQWRVVGKKGQKRLIKGYNNYGTEGRSRARGWNPRRVTIGRGRVATGAVSMDPSSERERQSREGQGWEGGEQEERQEQLQRGDGPNDPAQEGRQGEERQNAYRSQQNRCNTENSCG